MSNFLLKSPDCVFIHIPKTAGTSIRKGVWAKNYEGPAFGHIPEEWSGLFSFAFVRHPLDRFLSAYKMFTEGAKGDKEWRMPEDAYPLTLEQFIDIVLDETIIYDQRRRTFEEKIRHHTIPQTHPFNCLDKAKFVGRYENIENDFAQIKEILNINVSLPKMHTTSPMRWQDVLQGKNLQKLIDYYYNDFITLHYSIEGL